MKTSLNYNSLPCFNSDASINLKKPYENKHAVFGLLVCATLYPTIAQIGWLLIPDGIGGLSLMQWFQGFFFAWAVVMLPMVYRSNFEVRQIQPLVSLFAYVFALFLFKSYIMAGHSEKLILKEAIEYFKYFYFTFVWLFTVCVVRTHRTAHRLLACFVVGVIPDVLFKIFGFAFGEWNVKSYMWSGVVASFGAEGISGKATVGFLLPSVFLSWYLFKEKYWKATFLSSFFLFGVYITFDRSGQLAFCIALLWCIFWSLFISGRNSSRWTIFKFAIFLGLAFAIYFLNYGLDQVLIRWIYEVNKTGTVGSGRLAFWGTTWDWFKTANMLEVLIGQGHTATKDMIYQATGIWVHTHSDFFDMMSFGGLLGIFVYFYLLYKVVQIIRPIPRKSFLFQIAVANVLCFLVMSIATGQFAAIHAMFMLGGALSCLRLLATSNYPYHRNAKMKRKEFYNDHMYSSSKVLIVNMAIIF